MGAVKFILWLVVWVELLFGNVWINVMDVITFFTAIAILSAIYLVEKYYETIKER